MSKSNLQHIGENEKLFIEYIGKDKDFIDFWEYKSPICGIEHHYIFELEGKTYHISFTKISIVCGIVTNYDQQQEMLLYMGYSWRICQDKLEHYGKND